MLLHYGSIPTPRNQQERSKGTHKLCSHRARDITKRRIVLHYTLRYKVIELYITPLNLAFQNGEGEEILTASKYLDSPMRSRYRRQNGKVPKVFVMVLSNDLADVNLKLS